MKNVCFGIVLGLIIVGIFHFGALVGARTEGPEHDEKTYQVPWCMDHGGSTRVTFADGTHPDCVTNTHVIEFDFAVKWYESIGQALFYGFQMPEKKAGIVLIVGPDEERFWLRLNSVIEYYGLPVDTWKMRAE